MLRSTARRLVVSVTRNLGRSLSYQQNPLAQVLSKPLNSSSSISNFLSSVCPRKFHHRNRRFFSQCPKFGNVLDLLESNVDESLESTLDGMNLCLDETIVLRILRAHCFPRKHLIRFFKWVCCKKEFRVTTCILEEVQKRMMRSWGIECFQTDVYDFWELVNEIGEKDNGVLNAEILNKSLIGFAYLGDEKGVLDVYGKFEEFACIPNEDTYFLTIKSLCWELVCDQAVSVCRKMLDSGMLPGCPWRVTEIISLLCNRNRVKDAFAVYLESNFPTRYGYRFLLYCLPGLVYCLSKEDETVHLAQGMLCDIPAEKLKIFDDCFVQVIRGLCRKKDIESAKKLLFEMIEKGPPPQTEAFDCIIGCLARAGDLEDARDILGLAEIRGLTPKISSYSVIMNGYVKVGSMEEAFKVFLAAKKKHMNELCHASLYTLIGGYCKLGEFKKALKLFLEMNSFGVVPNVGEYNKLIQSLSLCSKGLDRKTAQDLLEEMREKGLYVPHITEGLIRVV